MGLSINCFFRPYQAGTYAPTTVCVYLHTGYLQSPQREHHATAPKQSPIHGDRLSFCPDWLGLYKAPGVTDCPPQLRTYRHLFQATHTITMRFGKDSLSYLLSCILSTVCLAGCTNSLVQRNHNIGEQSRAAAATGGECSWSLRR